MNTHDIELPPLPKGTRLPGAQQAWYCEIDVKGIVRAAIEADRKRRGEHVDDIDVVDTPAVSAEHATLNLQPSSSMQPVATAFFTEKGEVAFTSLFDRTLKALEAVKTTRMGISSGSIDLYAAPQPAEPEPR